MERKRELFQRYLEEKKVNDLLSKIIISLYETNEKPSDPLQYIRDFLAETDGIDLVSIRAENERLKKKINDLNKKLGEVHGEYDKVITARESARQQSNKQDEQMEPSPEENISST